MNCIELSFFFFLQGALSSCKYHSCHVKSPQGMGDLTKKVPKGNIHVTLELFW